MANVLDFKQVDDDLFFNEKIGDFEFVFSDNQHILDILRSYPGWWKNAPQVGAGLPSLLKGKVSIGSIEAIIKPQLEADGYQVGRPNISVNANGVTVIQPNAIRP